MTATEKLNLFNAALTLYATSAPRTITITKGEHGYSNDRDDYFTTSMVDALAYVDHNYNFDSIVFN